MERVANEVWDQRLILCGQDAAEAAYLFKNFKDKSSETANFKGHTDFRGDNHFKHPSAHFLFAQKQQPGKLLSRPVQNSVLPVDFRITSGAPSSRAGAASAQETTSHAPLGQRRSLFDQPAPPPKQSAAPKQSSKQHPSAPKDSSTPISKAFGASKAAASSSRAPLPPRAVVPPPPPPRKLHPPVESTDQSPHLVNAAASGPPLHDEHPEDPFSDEQLPQEYASQRMEIEQGLEELENQKTYLLALLALDRKDPAALRQYIKEYPLWRQYLKQSHHATLEPHDPSKAGGTSSAGRPPLPSRGRPAGAGLELQERERSPRRGGGSANGGANGSVGERGEVVGGATPKSARSMSGSGGNINNPFSSNPFPANPFCDHDSAPVVADE